MTYTNLNNGRRGEIVLTYDNLGNKLWDTVGQLLKILTEGDYQCVVKNNEPAMGIVEIEYCYKSSVEWGGDYVLMVDCERFEEIEAILDTPFEEDDEEEEEYNE